MLPPLRALVMVSAPLPVKVALSMALSTDAWLMPTLFATTNKFWVFNVGALEPEESPKLTEPALRVTPDRAPPTGATRPAAITLMVPLSITVMLLLVPPTREYCPAALPRLRLVAPVRFNVMSAPRV